MASSQPFQSIQFGDYLLVSKLGQGGMAEVFKARPRGLAGFAKIVCIKRIARQYSADARFVRMFVNEAKLSGRLSHPNIAQVYELGEVNGDYFMAMEFVHGRDLLRVMRAAVLRGLPPAGMGAYVARDMCRGLAHAHGRHGQRQPIIHRDVSPQNVMVSYEGAVKLVDFGIAKALEGSRDETRTGALKGKCAYLAPELLDGQKASPSTDIFAVGVTLFEMLTGKRLFKGPTDYDTLVRVKTQPVPKPSEINSKVPPEVDRIALKALDRDPAIRYQQAEEMAEELDHYLARERFLAADLRSLMAELFPDHTEIPDGVVAVNPPAWEGDAVPFQPPATVPREVLAAATILLEAPPARGIDPPRRSARWAALVLGLVAILGVGAVAVHRLARSSDSAPPRAVRSRSADPPLVETIHLTSSPPGAEVLDSTRRRLGTTPIDITFAEGRHTMTVALQKLGYEPLFYTLSSSDTPALELKLAPASRSRRARGPRQE